ncbi:MAG TPA: DinB family protein [Blastocatellia bacterium]|nr:DinB family protein [Blastocatellia bacterium]HMY71949.1 DinB family protein [Blastocatellia bacterium]HMZ20997.1 DinB family protein [Blastocatellia bacterium]HNG28815.1 DinB family protein [Blastocatellia bacterium]
MQVKVRSLSLSLLLIAGGFMLCVSTAFAQAKSEEKTVVTAERSKAVKETESAWKRAKKWTLDYVDAMPEDAVGFKPTPEVRSFAEQMLHLAFWNYGLAQTITGKPNPYGKEQDNLEKKTEFKSKAALRKVVEQSYDFVIEGLAGLDNAKLLEEVNFFNSKMTRMSILGIALDHQTHHRGQTTVYLRLKGVTPPPEP